MTGMSAHPSRRAFEHIARYYRGDRDFTASAQLFVEAALDNAEPVLAAAPTPRLDLLRSTLGNATPRVSMVDLADAGRNPACIIPVMREFCDRHPGRRTRLLTESTWGDRSPAERRACITHEALVNLAFVGHTATVLCLCDVNRLDAAIGDAFRSAHPFQLAHGRLQVNDRYRPDLLGAIANQPLPPRPPTAIERAVDAATVDHARWFATAYGRNAGLDATQLIDLEIAVTELATMTALTGDGTGLLRMWTDADHMVCEVSNRRHPSDPLEGRRPFQEADPLSRALLVVNQVVDLAHTHTAPDRTTTRIHLRLA